MNNFYTVDMEIYRRIFRFKPGIPVGTLRGVLGLFFSRGGGACGKEEILDSLSCRLGLGRFGAPTPFALQVLGRAPLRSRMRSHYVDPRFIIHADN